MALALLALAPALAATTLVPLGKARKKASNPLALSMPGASGVFSFTPAAADPRRAAAFSGGSIGAAGGAFRFTPSSAPGGRRAVTVAVRARAATKAEAERSASASVASLAPTAYNLGVAVGWKRFALSGDIARVEGGLLPIDRESADIGVSYSGNRWSTRLQVGADRATGDRPRLMGSDESYSVDLGGSYALTRNVEITGGMRYRLQRDRLGPIADERRDSQAVYIGTAFKF